MSGSSWVQALTELQSPICYPVITNWPFKEQIDPWPDAISWPDSFLADSCCQSHYEWHITVQVKRLLSNNSIGNYLGVLIFLTYTEAVHLMLEFSAPFPVWRLSLCLTLMGILSNNEAKFSFKRSFREFLSPPLLPHSKTLWTITWISLQCAAVAWAQVRMFTRNGLHCYCSSTSIDYYNCFLQSPLQSVLPVISVYLSLVLVVKNLPACAGDAEDAALTPGWGRSSEGGNGNPLQHSCLENPMDRGAWWATVHRVAKSQTRLKQLSRHTCLKVQIPWKHSLIKTPCVT